MKKNILKGMIALQSILIMGIIFSPLGTMFLFSIINIILAATTLTEISTLIKWNHQEFDMNIKEVALPEKIKSNISLPVQEKSEKQSTLTPAIGLPYPKEYPKKRVLKRF